MRNSHRREESCVVCGWTFSSTSCPPTTKKEFETRLREIGWELSKHGWLCNWHRGEFKKKEAALIFRNLWERYGDKDRPKREWKIEGSPDQWRYDFLWDGKLIVEIDGGVFTQGGHTRGLGFIKDCKKLNFATEQGYRILRFTPQMLENDPLSCIRQVKKVLSH